MKFLKISFLISMIIFSFSGCNIQNSANMLDYDKGTYIPDFGGNVVLAATTEKASTIQPIVLSTYTTKFTGKNAKRLHNIKKASLAIDETVLNPGDVFSFNEAVGPTKKETGFLLARIFVEGKDSEGYGGGVCQVSSTLYNAANEAGLQILERHSHSKPVTYVSKDHDAATSYGYKDFKFSNNRSYPVMINSFITDDGITVQIESV